MIRIRGDVFDVVRSRSISLGLVLACFLVFPHSLACAQVDEPVIVQEAEVILDTTVDEGLEDIDAHMGELLGQVLPDPRIMQRKHEEQIRGLVQNELNIVHELCDLSDAQRQALVDLAEIQWQPKSNAAIKRSIQENLLQPNDFDGLVERMLRTWCEQTLEPHQRQAYDHELESRMLIRKQATIDAMLAKLTKQLFLSFEQCQQIEAVLNEKWKDRWYKSLDSLINYNLGNEIRPSWIEPYLTPAQKTEFSANRESVAVHRIQVDDEFPRLSVGIRFKLGTLESSQSIPVGTEVKLKQRKAEDNSDDNDQ